MVPIGGWGIKTIQGYEAMNIIRKGQIRWLEKNDVIGQVRFINQIFWDCCVISLETRTAEAYCSVAIL